MAQLLESSFEQMNISNDHHGESGSDDDECLDFPGGDGACDGDGAGDVTKPPGDGNSSCVANWAGGVAATGQDEHKEWQENKSQNYNFGKTYVNEMSKHAGESLAAYRVYRNGITELARKVEQARTQDYMRNHQNNEAQNNGLGFVDGSLPSSQRSNRHLCPAYSPARKGRKRQRQPTTYSGDDSFI